MKILITAGLVAVKDRQLLLAFSNNKKALTGRSPALFQYGHLPERTHAGSWRGHGYAAVTAGQPYRLSNP